MRPLRRAPATEVTESPRTYVTTDSKHGIEWVRMIMLLLSLSIFVNQQSVRFPKLRCEAQYRFLGSKCCWLGRGENNNVLKFKTPRNSPAQLQLLELFKIWRSGIAICRSDFDVIWVVGGNSNTNS
jgi:hypothetical protein